MSKDRNMRRSHLLQVETDAVAIVLDLKLLLPALQHGNVDIVAAVLGHQALVLELLRVVGRPVALQLVQVVFGRV